MLLYLSSLICMHAVYKNRMQFALTFSAYTADQKAVMPLLTLADFIVSPKAQTQIKSIGRFARNFHTGFDPDYELIKNCHSPIFSPFVAYTMFVC